METDISIFVYYLFNQLYIIFDESYGLINAIM